MKQKQGNNQKNIQSEPLRKIMIMIIAMVFVFTACQKNTKPSLLLLLIDNSSNATTDGGSGSGGGSGGSGSGSGGGSGGSGSGSGGGSGGSGSGSGGGSGDSGSGSGGGSGGNGSGSGGQTFTPAIGVLDISFNSPNGFIIQPIGSSEDWGYSIAIQPDGKILLGGTCPNEGNYWDFCIARFNSNGTLDTSFGSSGKVIQPIGSSNDWGKSLAIQPDGKILLSGGCYVGSYIDFCIARFNSNGTLDTTFGSSGKVIQSIVPWRDEGLFLAIQPDGKILLGGHCDSVSNSYEDFCIARFNSNGTLDTSFGTSGKVIQPIGSSNDFGRSLVIQPDGKILLGGYCAGDFCIARFNSNGTLDTSFGFSGKVIQPIGSSDDAGQSLAIQPDGKILLGGYCFINTSNYNFCIARFNSDGSLNTSFGTSGKVIQHIGSYYTHCYGYSLAIQPDGKILLGGRCLNTNRGHQYFCIARFK